MTPFQHLRVEIARGVATATIDCPPINLMTLELFAELAALAVDIEQDDEVSVFVLRSSNADFFIAHFDVEAILNFDVSRPPSRSLEVNPFHQMCERFRTMPKITICEIAGRVGGGGAELAASFDLRYGALGKTVICQMEVALGILPGGTGTQRLPRLLGRSRALEMIAGCTEIDAATAERWGWLTRAFEPSELAPFVDQLARRIAGFPQPALASAKQAVLLAEHGLDHGMREEAHSFQELLRTPQARQRMQRFLAVGGQTAAGELRVGELCGELNESPPAKETERHE